MNFLTIYLVGVAISFFYARYVIVDVCTGKDEGDILVWVMCTLASWLGIVFIFCIHVTVAEPPKWLVKWFYNE